MTDRLFGRAEQILSSQEVDLRLLAELAGGDPRIFYRGANLNGADVRGQDLRGMEFSSYAFKEALYDESTRFEPGYDPIDFGMHFYQSVEIYDSVYEALGIYAESSNLRFRNRAIKDLLETCFYELRGNHRLMMAWKSRIAENDYVLSAFNAPRRQRTTIKVTVSETEIYFLQQLGAGFRGRSAGYTAAFFIGLAILSGEIPTLNKRPTTTALPLQLDLL